MFRPACSRCRLSCAVRWLPPSGAQCHSRVAQQFDIENWGGPAGQSSKRVHDGEPNLAIRARPEPRITHPYPSLPICGLWGPPKIPQVRWRSRATCREAPDLIPCRYLFWRIPLRRPARDIISQDHVDFDVDEFSRRDAALTRVSSQDLLCDGHSQRVRRFLPPPGRQLRRWNSPCGRRPAISACSP